jgi:hypothetical protein
MSSSRKRIFFHPHHPGDEEAEVALQAEVAHAAGVGNWNTVLSGRCGTL